MNTISAFISAHWESIILIGGYVSLAFINHLPKPGTHVSFYEYIYDVIQSLMNAPVIKTFQQKYGSISPAPAPIPNSPQGEVK